MKPSYRRAFSLIEIVAVAALIAVLAAITLPGVSERIVRNRITAEDAALKNMVASIRESFESNDLNNINIAVFPLNYADTGVAVNAQVVKPDPADPLHTTYTLVGELAQYPNTATPTIFSDDSSMGTNMSLPFSTSGGEWFIKLARQRGIDVSGQVDLDRSTYPELTKIAFNASERPRLLMVAPPLSTDASGNIRIMLVSLMASPEQLNLPPIPSDPIGKRAWFDAIWNFNFDTHTQELPALWANDLAWAGEAAKWQGDGSRSMFTRLRVERIALPRYTITVNNTHRSDVGTVYFNFNGSSIANGPSTTSGLTYPVTLNGGSDAIEIRGILAGRRVVVKRGVTGIEQEVLRFTLRENSDVAIQ